MELKILNDPHLDEHLEQEGYVVVPFLDNEEINTLVTLYQQKNTATKEGLYATAHSADYDYKKQLNDEILRQFTPAINRIFHECTPLGGSYIVKYGGDKGVLFPHQDWNIVDEDRYRSFNIWVPLVDTTENNGAITVLPHSHKLVKSFRGVNIPDPFYQVNSYTWKYDKTLNMKAGEALIYDHRLLHASSINKTDEPRLAVVFGIIPSKAEMRLYYMENGVVSEYASNVAFFFKNNILNGPVGLQKLREIDYKVEPLDEATFDELYLGKKRDSVIATTPAPIIVTEKSLFKKLLAAIGI